ncbi:MAG: hypothetical protein HRT37_18620 [Alteromonadaceae bacterium]|nr:hypothetical protein [Alteromonadaceae bacterium]
MEQVKRETGLPGIDESDWLRTLYDDGSLSSAHGSVGSFLVRSVAVPLPATVWLLWPALFYLIRVKHKSRDEYCDATSRFYLNG